MSMAEQAQSQAKTVEGTDYTATDVDDIEYVPSSLM